MPYLAQHTPLGKLKIQTVIVYYDIPRLFTCVNEHGQYYLALSIGDTDQGHDWAYANLTTKRLKDILTGKTDVLTAFTNPEQNSLLRVTTGGTKDTAIPIPPSDIPEDLLPVKGKCLDFKNKELPKIARPDFPKDDEMSIILNSFLQVRDAFSTDKVIADPVHNKLFINECKRNGIDRPADELNNLLMKARKGNQLKNLSPRTQTYTLDTSVVNGIEVASELAMQFMVVTRGLSVDKILCNPKLAKKFDELAARMSPGRKPFDYRWTALRVRKSGGLAQDAKKHIDLINTFEFKSPWKVTSLGKANIPKDSGVYVLLFDQTPLFVSHAESLRERIAMHLDTSKSRGLPDWIWPWKSKTLSVACTGLPGVNIGIRKGIVTSQIASGHATFNIQRKCTA